MKKAEFLLKLELGLSGSIPDDRRREILSDFEEHFAEALLAGESEESVCAVLGDPSEIAAQCLESRLWEGEQPNPAGRGAVGDPNVKKLLIRLFSYNIVCEPRAGHEFRVDILKNGEITEDNSIRIYNRDGEIGVVQEGDRKRLFVGLLFQLPAHREVRVYIPNDFPGEVEVNVFSGNIKMSGLQRLSTLSLGAKSGNISLEGVAAENGIRAVAGSGNVKLEDCRGGALHAESHSGNVKMLGCSGTAELVSRSGNTKAEGHKGNVNAKTISGNVAVDVDRIDSDAVFSTVSGNVKVSVNKLEAGLTGESVSGNVKLDIGGLSGRINIVGKTVSGSVSAELPADTKAVFTLKSPGKNERYSTAINEADAPVISLSTPSGRASTNVKPIK
jgi:hypothetical protein